MSLLCLCLAGDNDDSHADPGSFVRYVICLQGVVRQMFGGESAGVTEAESTIGALMTIGGGIMMAITYGNVAVLVASFFASSSNYKQKMQASCFRGC